MKPTNTFVTQVRLNFVVFGGYFNPEDFTTKLGLSPSCTWKKGDIIATNTRLRRVGQPPRRRESAWQYSKGFIQTLELNDAVIEFEKFFREKWLR